MNKAGTEGPRERGTKRNGNREGALFRLLLPDVAHHLDFVPDVVVPEILSHDMMVT